MVIAQQPVARIDQPLQAAKTALDLSALKISGDSKIRETPLGWIILLGFLGGLILNLMPCVLPVIGLKLLSFLEQSGHRWQRALALNLWYSLGLISVFLVLATLAVTLGLGWGQLFGYSGFDIALAAVVFAMGLSFLGVWEIPIPGFVGRGKTLELAEKEGAAGAVRQRRLDDPSGHALRRSSSGIGADVGGRPTARQNVRRVHRRRSRHGEPLSRHRGLRRL